MKVGVLVNLNDDMRAELDKVRALDMESCQVCCWNHSIMTAARARALRADLDASGVECSTFWCGLSGPAVWDFVKGPATLGLVPDAYREARVRDLKTGCDFAHAAGITQVASHMGFIPEDMDDPRYARTVDALREVARYAQPLGITLLFETGQETPTTLLRTFEDIGLPNLGANLDPANLLMYGKANPVDALSVIGAYVRDVHAKDGEYPTTGRALGVEKRLGDGRVNFPVLVRELRAVGYDGPLTIEREISGEEQIKDIVYARDLLRALI